MFAPGSALGVFSLQPRATLGLPCSLSQNMTMSNWNPQAPWPSAFLLGLAMEAPAGDRENIETEIFISLGLSLWRSPRLAILSTQVSSIPSSCLLAIGWSAHLCDQPQIPFILLRHFRFPTLCSGICRACVRFSVHCICHLFLDPDQPLPGSTDQSSRSYHLQRVCGQSFYLCDFCILLTAPFEEGNQMRDLATDAKYLVQCALW